MVIIVSIKTFTKYDETVIKPLDHLDMTLNSQRV